MEKKATWGDEKKKKEGEREKRRGRKEVRRRGGWINVARRKEVIKGIR